MKKTFTILLIAALAAIAAKAPENRSELVIRITNVKTDGKMLMVGVGDHEKTGKLTRGTTVKADSNTVICHIKNLPAGKQKVYVFHDENGNNKLDFSPGGRPAEGTGVDADNSWKPTVVLGDTPQNIEIRMVYFK